MVASLAQDDINMVASLAQDGITRLTLQNYHNLINIAKFYLRKFLKNIYLRKDLHVRGFS